MAPSEGRFWRQATDLGSSIQEFYEVTELTVPLDPVNSLSPSRGYSEVVVAAVVATSSSLTPKDLYPHPPSLKKGNQCPGQGTLGTPVPYLKTRATTPGTGGEASSSCLFPAC